MQRFVKSETRISDSHKIKFNNLHVQMYGSRLRPMSCCRDFALLISRQHDSTTNIGRSHDMKTWQPVRKNKSCRDVALFCRNFALYLSCCRVVVLSCYRLRNHTTDKFTYACCPDDLQCGFCDKCICFHDVHNIIINTWAWFIDIYI